MKNASYPHPHSDDESYAQPGSAHAVDMWITRSAYRKEDISNELNQGTFLKSFDRCCEGRGGGRCGVGKFDYDA